MMRGKQMRYDLRKEKEMIKSHGTKGNIHDDGKTDEMRKKNVWLKSVICVMFKAPYWGM